MEPSRDDFVIAIRSAFLKKGTQQKLSLLSLISFSIIFLILGNFNFKIIDFNKTVIREIIYYSSFIVNVPEDTIKKSINSVSDHFDHYDDYKVIKNKLQKLKNKDLEKKIILYENVELKKLINDYFVEDQQAYAKVLIDKNSPFLRSIIINKGSKNNVKTGMAVYDDIYLVGKIIEVNFLTSRVLLISDINSKVPITIQGLNIQGIMSGLDQARGQLQYTNKEKLINNSEKLIVITSGIGGIFKGGIPIGEVDSTDILINKKLIINFYRDFSQLKYVKISSHLKENIDIDQSIKKNFNVSSDKTLQMSNQLQDIKILKQQKIISDEVQLKLQAENTRLKRNLFNVQEKLNKSSKENQKNQKNQNQNLEFLELNLLHGHKCKKNFFKPKLFKVGSAEYKACVLNKGPIKKN